LPKYPGCRRVFWRNPFVSVRVHTPHQALRFGTGQAQLHCTVISVAGLAP